MSELPRWMLRIMQEGDIAAVIGIQAESYARGYHEAEATIRGRLEVSPDTAWVAQDADGVCAYLVGYRSVLGNITALGGKFAVVDHGDCLYLHDLAVFNRASGKGIGPALVRHALDWARQQAFSCSALVAVQDAMPFWRKQGYVEWAGSRDKLNTYPGSAWYMVKILR